MCVGGIRMSTIATSGLCMRDVPQQVVGVARLRDHLEARLLEQAHDALAQEHRVVGDDDAHRVAEHRDRVAQRREIARQPVGEQLVDVLGLGQPGEPVRAEVARRTSAEPRGRRRDEDLPAVAGRADAGGAVDVDAGVAVLRDERSPVWRPMRTRTACRPATRARRARAARHRRRGAASRRRRPRTARRRARRSRRRRARDRLAQDAAARRQDLRVRRARLVDEPGRPSTSRGGR